MGTQFYKYNYQNLSSLSKCHERLTIPVSAAFCILKVSLCNQKKLIIFFCFELDEATIHKSRSPKTIVKIHSELTKYAHS